MNKFHLKEKVIIKSPDNFFDIEGTIEGVFLYQVSDGENISYRISIPNYGSINIDEKYLEIKEDRLLVVVLSISLLNNFLY